jgi:hypothetical protein
VDGIVWGRIRELLDSWYADYPADGASDVRSRFRRKEPGAHWSAWWELYLHQLFTRLGYEAELHPVVPATSHRPDFRFFNADEQFYLEAAVVFSGIVEEGRDGTREGWILDAIDKGSDPNFFVRIDFESRGRMRPKSKAVREPILAWLSTLDPDDTYGLNRAGEAPLLRSQVGDWHLSVEAFAKPPERRGRAGDRLVGMGPTIAGMVDDSEQLRDTLKKKSRRYGAPEIPMVVAVNCATGLTDSRDAASALYGSVALQYDVEDPAGTREVRLPDGAWFGRRGPTGCRIAAALVSVQLHPWTVATAAPELWLNPHAGIPLSGTWPFKTWSCGEGEAITATRAEVEISKLLGLEADWPGPEPRFAAS